MQKTCPYRRVSRLDRPPWPSQLFLHFLTKFGEQQEQNVGLARRVICLTRDHGQRKNERKENGKKDRLVTLLTRKTFFIHYIHFDSPSWAWKERIRACTSSIFIGKTEMVISWLAQRGQRFSCILLYTLDWAGRVTLSPEATFLHKKYVTKIPVHSCPISAALKILMPYLDSHDEIFSCFKLMWFQSWNAGIWMM